MQEEKIQILISRYLSGNATEAEYRELMDWYQRQNQRPVEWHQDRLGEDKAIKANLYANLQHHINKPSASRSYSIRFWLPRVAALLLLVSGLLLGLSIWNGDQVISAPRQGLENRYVMLPDGSKVILRAGSEILYPKTFKGDTREVTLEGEAFFDVARDTEKPFIIHTGKLKTIVLGTAFNIQAFPDQQQVSVSVSRGKVRVENESEVLAVLTPDEQLVYSKQAEVSAKHNVSASEMSAWMEKDMQFDALPFKTIAERLERRYETEIRFQNPAMASCPISGRFSGTESLRQVLDILCATRNASYTMRQGLVSIYGEGCGIAESN